MFSVYLLFILGCALLVKGADLLIDGAVSLARRLNVSEMIVGLTVVAFGTSAPELVVNVVSSIRGAGGITVGNVVGSNIANLALVLGATGLFATLAIKRELFRKEIPLSLVGAGLIFVLATGAFGGDETLTLSRMSGGILLVGFVGFLYWIWREIKSWNTSSLQMAWRIFTTAQAKLCY